MKLSVNSGCSTYDIAALYFKGYGCDRDAIKKAIHTKVDKRLYAIYDRLKGLFLLDESGNVTESGQAIIDQVNELLSGNIPE